MLMNIAVSMAGGISAVAEMAQTNQAGRHWASVAMYTVIYND
jgi:hypothetical protein